VDRRRHGSSSWHASLKASLVTVMLISQAVAQHALAAVPRSWENVGELRLLIAG